MKKAIFSVCAAGLLLASCSRTSNQMMQVNNSDAPCGIQQAQALWTSEDGSQEDFQQLVDVCALQRVKKPTISLLSSRTNVLPYPV